MKKLIPYLNFNGQCQQALAFYQQCFENARVDIQTFANMPGELPDPAMADLVMHAEFNADGVTFMATDGQPDMPFTQGNNIHLSVQLESTEEQTRLFEHLSEGGQIVMELQDTFWQSRFGMCNDKFGIQWMLNVPKG